MGQPLRRLLSLGVLLGVVIAVGWSPGAAAPPIKGTYVALGDSYAAGPLIPAPEGPWGCLRSSNNYPKLVAARLGLELRDATCSGAETEDMEAAQGVDPEPNPPQFDRLDKTVRAVTLQIGGNDIGFSGIAQTCGRAAFERSSCRERYEDPDAGTDELRRRIDETADDVARVIAGIQERSPKAAVFVLGYPAIFRLGGAGVPASCPAMGVGEGDARYLQGVQEALNAMIAAQAAAAGVTYVDVYGPSAGRTACDLPAVRWLEPLVPVHAAAPIHPNLNGMLGMADVVQGAFTGAPAPTTDLRLPTAVEPLVPAVPSPY
ncbi:MAG TPA: SGNH/GDSL hydrolase family protein [Acidimicrobiales bacterium]|nr:SGNH/GDSL hydrolase family protein [Acidimicrobiales bacterium]